ncbi:MATE family efflux transporter [uncultured Dubosiella sp.]|uniref:MATE family efflux transporter n=2 Tax=uncultured Dubosiella sp. TaxID=1937011 RepID=UPI00266FE5FC|nr:MATE family efflux transporter [uncultured Dubosiella sp.]
MAENPFERNWTAPALLRFAFPTIIMMLSMGLYTLADTIFVARFVNTDALSAINIVCPVVNLTVGLGTMIATGANAIVSRNLGAGQERAARENFTLLVLCGALLGLALFGAGLVWIDSIVTFLGASQRLFPYAKADLEIVFLFVPAQLLQTIFSNLFVTAGKPGLGFGLSVFAGLANLVLDVLFMTRFHMGIQGAALGTGIGYSIGAIGGLVFFSKKRGPLFFTRPAWNVRVVIQSLWNGSSEMVSQVSSAVTTFLFNRAMLIFANEEGVAAITILIYSQFLLNTVFIGYSIGVAPIIGYNLGEKNTHQQKRVFALSVRFIAWMSIAIFVLARWKGADLIGLFAPSTSSVYQITKQGFPIFAISFLFCGFNLFVSSMFTALSNGAISALLSFLRTFVFLAGAIVLLPEIWGINGIWSALPLAEGAAFLFSSACCFLFRKRYGYA